MLAFETALLIVVSVAFGGSALFAIYRIVVGPTILDRMIASDVLLTTLILIVGADMVFRQHTQGIPLMIVLAATGVFASITVARYVSKQDRQPDDSTDTSTHVEVPR